MRITADLKSFVRTFFAIATVISLMAIYQTQLQTEALQKIRTRYKWALLMALFAANVALGLYVVLLRDDAEAFLRRIGARIPETRLAKVGGVLLLLLPLPILWIARQDFFGRDLEGFFRLLWLFWWLALAQAAGVKLMTRLSWPVGMAAILLLDGLAAQIYTLALPVTNYPFSNGWSEASRFYYGSLVFSKSIYGVSLPLSVWHGTRYLLLAIPFLWGAIPIWAARLWQVLLWIGITGTTSWILTRRLGLRERTAALILAGWLFLFLFQGAVYYHLQVCVIIILLGVSYEHPRRSLVAVFAASFWAGMSRLNWYPVPAMLAIALYLLEVPRSADNRSWRYARTPILWGVAGLLAAFAGQACYIAISRNTNLEAFGSSLTSALLWYRWLPSPTNPIGIIPGVLIVSLPLWALIRWGIRGRERALDPVRWLGLLALLLVLLVGGLVVSTKIGGGGDLHNMDAYMVLLALIGTCLMCGRVAWTLDTRMSLAETPWSMAAWIVIVPVAFSILRIGSPFSYDAVKAAADVSILRQDVQSYAGSGDVLFMYERQLLTFGMIPQVRVVPEYEVVSLMEMAISGNQAYLGQFYRDLASHRFSAIVTHPQNLGVETGDFIEESSAWNRLVAQPMLCQYKPALTLEYSKVQILVPRARPCTEFPPVVNGQ
jgi:hypothetical protein